MCLNDDSSCYTMGRLRGRGVLDGFVREQRLARAARLLAGFQRRDAVLADAPRAPLVDLGGLRGDVVAPLDGVSQVTLEFYLCNPTGLL